MTGLPGPDLPWNPLERRELRVALREGQRRIPEDPPAPGYPVRCRPPLRFVPDLQLAWAVDG